MADTDKNGEQKEDLKRTTISASRITSYQMCGEAYRRRYVLGDVRPPAISLIKGSSFHKMAETNYAQKIKSKTDLDVESLKDCVSDQIEIAFQKEVFLSKIEQSIGKSKLKGDAKDVLVASADTYREVAQSVMPREVESFQRLKLSNSSRDILYVMDVETEDDRIIDNKFSAKKKTQKDVDTNLGLTAYGLAFVAKNKRPPKKIAFHNFVGRKTPKTGVVKTEFIELNTDRDQKDFETFIRRAEEVIKGIDAEIFTPAPVGSWKCSPVYCEYFDDCVYVNTARKAFAEGGDNDEQ